MPRLWRRGNPLTSEQVIVAVTDSNREGDTYTELGASPLTIGELYRLHAYLTSRGIRGFLLWTKILWQIHLTLREDELNDFKDSPAIIERQTSGGLIYQTVYNCFNWDTTVYNAKGELECLGVAILGKIDKAPVNLDTAMAIYSLVAKSSLVYLAYLMKVLLMLKSSLVNHTVSTTRKYRRHAWMCACVMGHSRHIPFALLASVSRQQVAQVTQI